MGQLSHHDSNHVLGCQIKAGKNMRQVVMVWYTTIKAASSHSCISQENPQDFEDATLELSCNASLTWLLDPE
jgi:hypothetical protein